MSNHEGSVRSLAASTQRAARGRAETSRDAPRCGSEGLQRRGELADPTFKHTFGSPSRITHYEAILKIPPNRATLGQEANLGWRAGILPDGSWITSFPATEGSRRRLEVYVAPS